LGDIWAQLGAFFTKRLVTQAASQDSTRKVEISDTGIPTYSDRLMNRSRVWLISTNCRWLRQRYFLPLANDAIKRYIFFTRVFRHMVDAHICIMKVNYLHLTPHIYLYIALSYPTIVIYKASAVKFYSATSSLVRLLSSTYKKLYPKVVGFSPGQNCCLLQMPETACVFIMDHFLVIYKCLLYIWLNDFHSKHKY
jgi:hypothetical protein